MNDKQTQRPDTPIADSPAATTPAGIAMTITRAGDTNPGPYFRTHQATITPLIPGQRTGGDRP